jgi:hypothetical protein
VTKLETWERAIADFPGSTRPVGLIRIGLALLAIAEMGDFVTVRESGLGISALVYGSAIWMLIGYQARVATFFSAIAVWLTIHLVPTTLHHHTYIEAVASTALAFTPCGASFSVDRWLAVHRAKAKKEPIPEERGNLWATRIIGLQMSALFFWGGYHKLTLGTQSIQTAFIHGDRLEQTLIYYYSLPVPFPTWLRLLVMALAAGVTAFEMFAGIGLWIPKVRPYVLFGCFMMTTSFQTLLSVRTFGFLSALLYLVFIPSEKIHAVIDRVLSRDMAAALVRMGVAFVALAELAEIIHPRKQYWLVGIPFLFSIFAMATGFKSRAASVATALSVALVAWKTEGMTRDMYLLIPAAALVALLPCGNSLSVDRYLSKAPAPETDAPLTPKLALAAVSALCLWSAYSQFGLELPYSTALSLMIFVGGGALWSPKWRLGGMIAAIVAMAAARFYLLLPSVDLLLAMTFAVGVLPPAAFENS